MVSFDFAMKNKKKANGRRSATQAVELCTFPSSKKYRCTNFYVPKCWLLSYLKAHNTEDNYAEAKLKFLVEENYSFDETWPIYLQALKEDMVEYEMEEK